MSESKTALEFATEMARVYRPSPTQAKTAILVRMADPAARSRVVTGSGVQVLAGDFYVVLTEQQKADAVPRDNFEAEHVQLEPGRWQSGTPVLAYRSEDDGMIRCEATAREFEVAAEDWIMKQPDGSTLVLGHQASEPFDALYDVGNPLPLAEWPRIVTGY